MALRVETSAGARLRILAAGLYHWGDRTWSGTLYEPASSQGVAFGEKIQTWGAHVGLVFATPFVDRLVLAGSAVHYDEPLSGLNASGEIVLAQQKAALGVVTVAAEKILWRTLVVRAGVSGDYRKVEASSQDIAGNDVRSRAQETLSDSFHWGLAYRWRALRFETALRSPPDVASPFERFDLYWSF